MNSETTTFKTLMENSFGWDAKPPKVRWLTPDQINTIKWWETKWFQDWQRSAGIQHP